jgi:CheY-like chemotaxis protein
VNLYLVKQIDPDGYDVMDGCVVVAEDGPAARELASRAAKDEGEAVWLRSTESTVTLLGAALDSFTEPTVILTDVHNG